MPRIVVTNNSDLLRCLAAPPFRRLDLEIAVASSVAEVLEAIAAEQPALAIVDSALPGGSGYALARDIKLQSPACRVVVVADRRIGAAEMRLVVDSGCDEVVIAPVGADQLYDVVAVQLALPRRGSERFDLDLAVVTDDGERSVDGRVTNLSIDGARLVLPEPMGEGTRLRLTITSDDADAEPIEVGARVVWAQSRDEATIAGAAFEDVDDAVRARLCRLIQWEIESDAGATRVVIKGDLTEATNFEALFPALVGRLAFDLSHVGYINSLGIRAWTEFLRRLDGGDRATGDYDFWSCSIPFVLQASIAPEVLGRGRIESFFAPYRCQRCDHEEERLLQTRAIVAGDLREPPLLSCPSCDGRMRLDDAPERFLGFLDPPGE